MGSITRLLFGHERAVFTNGQFGFDVRPGPLAFILIALFFSIFIYVVYIRPRLRLSKRMTLTLALLRTTLMALLVFMLLRPVVVVSSVVPRSSYVALAIDDSLSMTLRDTPGGTTRLEWAKQVLLGQQGSGQSSGPGSFLTRLEEKFRTNLYGFSGELAGVKDGDNLFGEGRTTDLVGALDEIAKRSSGTPLSAIVLATDGASNVSHDLNATLRELRARDVPVFTVGIGEASRPLDAELVGMNMPRRVLVGSRANIEAFVRLSRYGPTRVLMRVTEDGRAIKTEEFNLRGNDTQPVNLEISPSTSGFRRYTVEITPLDGEVTLENNKQEALVEVIDGPLRVLHVEGEPRWELGKIRESLQPNEKNVTHVSLQRTGENKFYRQGIAGQQELVGGFPKTEEELFAYHGLVIGSVESSFFTADQLRNIEAFVSRRGGGLLAIGGRLAFDGGKYHGTPVANLLPITLEGRNTNLSDAFAPVYKPQLTGAGQAHPISRLNEDRNLSQKIWNELPSISISEALKAVKPGATVLLEAKPTASSGPAVPLLVQQRYGAGQTLAFMATDTWRWRMRMDSKSNAHETFWRQMLRYLVSGTPSQIEVGAGQNVYVMGDEMQIIADIRDQRYNAVNDAHATVRVTKPSGATLDVPLNFITINNANIYSGKFKADELGQHTIELTGTSSIGPVSAKSRVLVSDLNREFYSAAQNRDLLQRIAADTGGKYYQLSDVQTLLDDLTYRRTPFSERVTKDLWDMPINFILVIGLLSGEWFLRKREGLA